MKTIDKAAKDFSEDIRENSLSGNNAGKEQYKAGRKIGFKAGVEFAQRWIPVEEERPTKGIEIIAKNKHRKVVYEVKTNDDVKYICETFTNWRLS